MTHDGLAGLDLQYNLLNLTKRISSGGTTLADYHYLADGTRAAAERGDGTGVQYRGSLIYTKEADGGLELDCALTSGGRIANDAGTLQVQHFIRDHLGSVRTIVDGSTGDVLETSDYLPFGKRWDFTGGQAAQTVTDPTNRWRFSGKETQSFYNPAIPYNDFGARLHDPRTGRWLGVDPMAEKYSWQSAYSYCSGSPVMYVDSDGKDNYIFKNNRYVRTVTTNSTHTIINTNTATHETYSISFVDPDNDPSKIGPKMRLVEVSDNDIEQALEKSGANSIKNHGLFKGMKYLLDNSNANSLERTGLMDFTGSGDYNIETDDVLYITTTNKDGKVAHNGYNYGNFLWGAGAKRLGVPRKIAKIGAHVNNFLHDVESRFHLDSKDDQKSISMGINWAKEHKNK